MTTPTPEHIAEAKRRLASVGYAGFGYELTAILAEALASPAWEPPEDADLVLARHLRATCPNIMVAQSAADRLEQIAAGRAAERKGGGS
jgi:hypothetical protein